MGAALGVEGQTQCSLALKARLDLLLNQVFVSCIGLHVFRGGPLHKATTVLLNGFNSEVSFFEFQVRNAPFFLIPPVMSDSYISPDGSRV